MADCVNSKFIQCKYYGYQLVLNCSGVQASTPMMQ